MAELCNISVSIGEQQEHNEQIGRISAVCSMRIPSISSQLTTIFPISHLYPLLTAWPHHFIVMPKHTQVFHELQL